MIDYDKVRLELTLKGFQVTKSSLMTAKHNRKYLEIKDDMWYAQIESVDRKLPDILYTVVKDVYFKNFYAESILSPNHAERLVLEKWVNYNGRLRKN